MKNFIIFTYKEDFNSLLICVKFILKGNSHCRIWVYDDLFNPFSNEQKETLLQLSDNISYSQTTFDRQGTFRMRNLNGHECIRGMAQIYNHVANSNGGSIIKIDSDTILLSSKVFDDLENDSKVIGFECLNPYEFSGICYGLSNQACKDIAKHIAQRKFTHPTDINYFAEDITFSRIASFLYGYPQYDLRRNKKDDGSLYIIGLNNFNENILELLKKSIENKSITAIHCGQEAFCRKIAEDNNITYREAVHQLMTLTSNELYELI